MTGTRTARRRTSAETREHVLQTAHELFYWHGIRAVGVDKVAAEAGIAPTTLYRLFASKDDLVAAYVERAGQAYREWFTAATRDDGRDPRERILTLFDELVVRIQPEHCRGCPFLMALTEFPDAGVAGHRESVALKRWVRERFGELAEELARTRPVDDPAELADRLFLVMEGAYAAVQSLGIDGPAGRVRAFAEAILPG
ncbi:TetR/AcrR family transcriptional regulator [Thermomonospora cellulosilytica]|uniref:AcrR family transcriptional regulator n=1 Tax=Thermomonospora cellulosilytica TaxID=1411118 RepID=A0A7W3MVD6_9ACTN|nr:TetR/AcrR family transcriptional regulator [Thermomonospora cellulosilytica]MBA9002622.1 AcrR family transcriptional regulator [Thermomonospora cellulosilytica]